MIDIQSNNSDHLIQDTWISLLRASRKAVFGVDAALKRKGLPPLEWYDILLELDREGVVEMRPLDLQEKLLLAQYNMSRILKRMEDARLVTCKTCSEDGRGKWVAITRSGRDMRRRMWLVYEEQMALFFTKLWPGQMEDLNHLLKCLR